MKAGEFLWYLNQQTDSQLTHVRGEDYVLVRHFSKTRMMHLHRFVNLNDTFQKEKACICMQLSGPQLSKLRVRGQERSVQHLHCFLAIINHSF